MSDIQAPGKLTFAPQVGTVGQCHMAQIFDEKGQSVACLDSTPDPAVATERARRLTACWNRFGELPTELIEEMEGTVDEVVAQAEQTIMDLADRLASVLFYARQTGSSRVAEDDRRDALHQADLLLAKVREGLV